MMGDTKDEENEFLLNENFPLNSLYIYWEQNVLPYLDTDAYEKKMKRMKEEFNSLLIKYHKEPLMEAIIKNNEGKIISIVKELIEASNRKET